MRHSILFKINIIFAIAFSALLFLTVSVFHFKAIEQDRILFDKLSNMTKGLRVEQWGTETEMLKTLAISQGLQIIDENIRSEILIHSTKKMPPHVDPQLMPPMRFMSYKGFKYVEYQDQRIHILFKDIQATKDPFPWPLLFMVVITFILILVYIFVRKSLSPLQMMHEQMIAYGQGREIQPIEKNKKDELSVLYQEFYQSVKKVREIENARKFFLRNIMHELNTPIAKGKIISAMSENENKDILHNIFERLDLLVKELASVEQYTSGNYTIKMNKYRIIDLIDHAQDMLYGNDGFISYVQNQTLICDFEMMSLVFKNLIDNSLKYGERPAISYRYGSIYFTSIGKPLEHPLQYYTEPFTKGSEYENSIIGLGLGLYIVKEILSRQGYQLNYFYLEDRNNFVIIKQENTSCVIN